MQFLGPFHPQITHVPIVLIIVSLVFEHGAAVSLHGQPLQEGPPRERGAGRDEGGRKE